MADEWQPKPIPIDPATGLLVLPVQGLPGSIYGQVLVSSDGDALKNHLGWGRSAIGHVKRYMTIGASNKLGDVVSSLGRSLVCVAQARSEEDLYASRGVWEHQMKIAEIGMARGCGNCQEQSAMALKYLSDNGMFPIDGMEVDAGDHRFVALGRKDGDVYNLATWGPRAVVVDPWNGVTYPASELRAQRGSEERWSHFVRRTK